MTGKANLQLKALSTPAATEPDCSPLSEKELAKFEVADFDQLLPRLQIAAAILRQEAQTAPVQRLRRIVESGIKLMEAA